MSLFALKHEYQRSIDIIMEEFSGHSRAQTKRATQVVEDKSHQPVLSPGSQREGFVQSRVRNSSTYLEAGESEFIQHDGKAWERFLDSKCK